MKTISIITLLFIIACNQSLEPTNEENPTVPTVTVVYKTSAHDLHVTYCREDGALAAKYNTKKFIDTLYIPVGQTACLAAEKINPNYNISTKVYIYVNDELVAKSEGKLFAAVSYEL